MNKNSIRQYFDENTKTTYYSIVDIIDALGISSDSRNYWKVLKNRLKNTLPQLVTNCNQVKMLARDGKVYLTDSADEETILKIIQSISPKSVSEFRDFFDKNGTTSPSYQDNKETLEEKLSPQENEENEISIDAWQKNGFIYVQAFIAGVNSEDIFTSITCKNILIKGKRFNKNQTNNYEIEELFWGKFYREVELPHEVEIDQAEANFSQGLLTIKIPIIDKDRTKILRIKNS